MSYGVLDLEENWLIQGHCMVYAFPFLQQTEGFCQQAKKFPGIPGKWGQGTATETHTRATHTAETDGGSSWRGEKHFKEEYINSAAPMVSLLY